MSGGSELAAVMSTYYLGFERFVGCEGSEQNWLFAPALLERWLKGEDAA